MISYTMRLYEIRGVGCRFSIRSALELMIIMGRSSDTIALRNEFCRQIDCTDIVKLIEKWPNNSKYIEERY